MNRHPTDQRAHDQDGHEAHEGQRSHGLMMVACCAPMLVIAGILVATGVVSVGFIFLAIGCTAMMALMMRGMDHGPGDQN